MKNNRIITKEERILINKILKRAEENGYTDIYDDMQSALMDVESAFLCFNMRLEDWLNADEFNFAHDFCGIANHIVRDKFPAQDYNFFLPRFSQKSDEVSVINNENDI